MSVDGIVPQLLSYALALDNGYLELTFSEGVYDWCGGPVGIDRFLLSYTANGSNAVVNLSDLRGGDGLPLAGGESVAILRRS